MPKIVDHDLYRKELLSKCFDLFAQKGYASITMREIAKELRVSTGTLYHYFPSKEALFEQLIEELAQQDIARVTAELKQVKTLPERIETIFDWVAKNEAYLLKQMFIQIDFYQQQGIEKIQQNQAFKQLAERALAEVTKILELQDSKIIILVSALIDGLILGRLYNSEMVSIKEEGALLKKMLVAYLERENS
jgi:AcrR family transcriptional regulator